MCPVAGADVKIVRAMFATVVASLGTMHGTVSVGRTAHGVEIVPITGVQIAVMTNAPVSLLTGVKS